MNYTLVIFRISHFDKGIELDFDSDEVAIAEAEKLLGYLNVALDSKVQEVVLFRGHKNVMEWQRKFLRKG